MSDRLRFDRFELRPSVRQLMRDGEPVHVGARAFDVLLLLVEHRDRLVTKAELLDRVWAGLVVEEANVQVQVSTLRKVLGAGAIATIPGLGYRLAMASDTAACGRTPVRAEVRSDAASGSSNLPMHMGPLVGREDDLAALDRMLDVHRLVTVVGAGGVGKSSLALAAAHRRHAAHRRGVWWVDLAALSTADQIVPAIAKAAQLSLGDTDDLPRLVAALSRHDLLLVLDNCEHLATPLAGVVHAILEAAAGVRLLTTSQQALGVSGEQQCPLSPLDVPAPGTPLAAARAHGAIQLLERRAGAVDRRFAVTAANLPQAIALCAQLEGLPLAIEMAAARLPLLGFAGLQPLLEAPLDHLQAGLVDAPERQRSLRRTLDWSHALLGADERMLLRRLSLFAGSVRLEVAQEAAAFGRLDWWRALDALVGLVEKSLVQVVGLEPPRYRLPATTRLYARERLAAAGETEAVQRRHMQAMASLAEEARRQRLQLPSTTWLQTYLPDYEDLDLAFVQACRCGDADAAAAIVGPLRLIDQMRGLLASSTRRVQAACELLDRAGPLGQARLHSFIASCGWTRPPRGTRVGSARQAVALWRQLGDARELHGALAIAATECARTGAHDLADALLQEAGELEAPDWPGRAVAVRLIHAGWVAHCRGEGARYRDRIHAALALCEQEGETALAHAVRVLLASAALETGDAEAAIAHARSAIDALRPSNQGDHLSHALSLLCRGLLMDGDVAGAAAAAREALALMHSGDAHRPHLMRSVAALAASAGLPAAAARLIGHAQGAVPADEPAAECEARLDAQVWQAIVAALGSADALRLRSAGASLDEDAACRLARTCLAGGTACPLDGCG